MSLDPEFGINSAARAGTEWLSVCPACSSPSNNSPIEKYGKYALYACASCDLHYWYPRLLPDFTWYERMYGGRDQKMMPLEPGHKYFLMDPLAPRHGKLLDIGCGTGNFLSAARIAGYDVVGIELDRNAAKFATAQLGSSCVYPLTAMEFAEQNSGAEFDVVTFFEVLEHQANPGKFIDSICKLLRTGGIAALSVPNRERWLSGPDVLDYPPNHFLRWNHDALRRFLRKHGFQILRICEEPASILYSAQMFHRATRTGLMQKAFGGAPDSFRDIMQMSLESATAALTRKATLRQRVMRFAGRLKYIACFPLALAAHPYVRQRGFKGAYLYCLAQLETRL